MASSRAWPCCCSVLAACSSFVAGRRLRRTDPSKPISRRSGGRRGGRLGRALRGRRLVLREREAETPFGVVVGGDAVLGAAGVRVLTGGHLDHDDASLVDGDEAFED